MTQRKSLNSQSQSINVSNDSEAINDCVRYILYREGSKLPIKRADIASHLLSTRGVKSNEVSGVVAGAQKVLNNVYGYNLVKDDTKGVVQYMLVLTDPCEDSLPSPLVEPQEYILLNAALAHIFMSGGSVKEEELWKFLHKAGLMKENDSAVTNLFRKKFKSQLYITYTKKENNNLLKATFEWGPRAHKEASKMFILQKVAKAFDKQPEFWCEQHKDASNEASKAST